MTGHTRRGWRSVALALVFVVAAVGCTGGGGDPAEPPAGDRRWLAVFETAADPDDLDAVTSDLLDRIGGGAVASPAGCFPEGLEGSGIAAGDYVVGVVAETRADLEELVERTGREPIFSGRVTDACGE